MTFITQIKHHNTVLLEKIKQSNSFTADLCEGFLSESAAQRWTLSCLWQDGGLFTFGDGSWGQLGHGSTNNELLPRRVLELMGTEVSQITCGRYCLSNVRLVFFLTSVVSLFSSLTGNSQLYRGWFCLLSHLKSCSFYQTPHAGVRAVLWSGVRLWL